MMSISSRFQEDFGSDAVFWMDKWSISFSHHWSDLARVGIASWFRPPVGHAVNVLATGLQTDVYHWPEELDEKVATIHFLALDASSPLLLRDMQHVHVGAS